MPNSGQMKKQKKITPNMEFGGHRATTLSESSLFDHILTYYIGIQYCRIARSRLYRSTESWDKALAHIYNIKRIEELYPFMAAIQAGNTRNP